MSDQSPLKVGVVGLGTVGVGAIEKIDAYNSKASKNGERLVDVTHVCARDPDKDRGISISGYEWVSNPLEMMNTDVDVVVELIGSQGNTAVELIEGALEQGKHVVTANKDLMASPEGLELASLADGKGLSLNMEAAVLGGNQVIGALRRGHLPNTFTGVSGIMNGTTNYMLGLMVEQNMSYEDALADAQAKGYAEADPTSDVEGYDAYYKLNIMTAIARGVKTRPERPETIGISKITPADLAYAQQLDRGIKHLGTMEESDGKIMQTVSPWLVKSDNPLYGVGGATNAVTFADANGVESYTYIGPGAGREATATSVVADIIAIARGESLPTFGQNTSTLQEANWGDVGELREQFYVRVNARDIAGAANIFTGIMREQGISIKDHLQDSRLAREGSAPIAVTTHPIQYQNVKDAVAQLEEASVTEGSICVMRFEA